MTKVQQKSEKISAFGGIFFVLDKFDRILSSVIDSHLGLRSKLIGYQYSEIMLTLTLQGTGTCSMYRRISELQHCSKCNGREQRKKKEPAGILQALLLDINIRNLLVFDWRFLTTTHNVL